MVRPAGPPSQTLGSRKNVRIAKMSTQKSASFNSCHPPPEKKRRVWEVLMVLLLLLLLLYNNYLLLLPTTTTYYYNYYNYYNYYYYYSKGWAGRGRGGDLAPDPGGRRIFLLCFFQSGTIQISPSPFFLDSLRPLRAPRAWHLLISQLIA